MSYYKKNKEVLLKKAYNKYHNGGGKERVSEKVLSRKQRGN